LEAAPAPDLGVRQPRKLQGRPLQGNGKRVAAISGNAAVIAAAAAATSTDDDDDGDSDEPRVKKVGRWECPKTMDSGGA